MAIIELFCHLLGILKPGSNIFISHFYFVFQFLIITMFFLQLTNSKVFKKFIYIITVLVLLVIISSYVINKDLFWKFNLLEIGLTSLVLVAYIIFYFYRTMENENVKFYYFFGGLVVYLLSSSLIFLTGNEELVIIKTPFYIDIWVFNSLFYIVFQFFIFKEIQFLKKSIN